MTQQRGYQLHLSRGDFVLRDPKSRAQNFRKILSVIQDFYPETQSLTCLDIGCSSGIIASLLGDHFRLAIVLTLIGRLFNMQAFALHHRGSSF